MLPDRTPEQQAAVDDAIRISGMTEQDTAELMAGRKLIEMHRRGELKSMGKRPSGYTPEDPNRAFTDFGSW